MWDLNGNLQQRRDLAQNLTEVFTYDELNRLKTSTLNTIQNLSVNYDAAGNITSKSDVGGYNYTTNQAGCSYTGLPAQPHAVRKAGTTVYCYDKNGNMISRGGSTISWYSYNQPNSIASGSNSTQFNYNASHQRWKQVAVDSGSTTTTYYVGGILEKVIRPTGVTEYRHAIPAGGGTAIYTRRSNSTNSTYYVTTDHLGSGDLVLDSAGTVLARESFTPFGERRGSNWQGLPSAGDKAVFADVTRRGFTGHEMLDAVNLIHMNGRVYDPRLGRFLSADPIIQTIALSQALNPFSYVMNNPLTLIDPTGYFGLKSVFKSIGRFIKKWGATIISIGFAMLGHPYIGSFISSMFSTAVNGGNFGSFLKGFAIGMAAGLVAGPVAGFASRALGLAGGSIFTQFFRGALAGGIAGGLASSVSGGSFWAGAAGGAITGGITAGAIGAYRARLLNQLMKSGQVSCNPCSRQALEGLREYSQSPQGQAFLRGLRSTGGSLLVKQGSEYNQTSEFVQADAETGTPNTIGLPADLAAYRSGSEMPGEQSSSATFGNLIAHEAGHYYPGGTRTIGYTPDGGIETSGIRPSEIFASVVENGHRLWMGQPPRTYSGSSPVPMRYCTYCVQ